MSFGFGVGDFLAVSKLALDVYTGYKDAPKDFQNISDEIKSLHIIVDRHKDEFRDKTLSSDEETQLRGILEGCTHVLEDLDKLRMKYMSLGSAQGSSSQATDRIKWTQENIQELRARLSSHTGLLTSFIAGSTHAEMREIKSLLLGLRRKNSTLSFRSIASSVPSVKTKEAMKQLCKILHKAGVRGDMIQGREDLAVGVFQNQNAPPVVNQEVSQIAGSVADDEELSAERQKSGGGHPASRINWTSLGKLRGQALHAATALGLTKAVQILLDSGADMEVQVYPATGVGTPLDTAAFYGRIEVVRLLLEKGANIDTTKSTFAGVTPLVSAAYNGHTDVMRLLLQKGASIEATTSDYITTPLDTAVYRGHIEVVGLLLENGANIDATRCYDGATALHTAVEYQRTGIMRLLLEKGANIETTRSDDGATALHTAAKHLHTEAVRLLLEKGANIHATTKQAETALHSVFYVSKTDYERKPKDPLQLIPTIKVLLAHGANILQTNENGQTPLDLAEEGRHLEAKRLFVRHIEERNIDPPLGV